MDKRIYFLATDEGADAETHSQPFFRERTQIGDLYWFPPLGAREFPEGQVPQENMAHRINDAGLIGAPRDRSGSRESCMGLC